jgi:hypothetical protein
MRIKLNIFIGFLLLGYISPGKAQPNKSANDSIKTNDTAVWVIKNRPVPVRESFTLHS